VGPIKSELQESQSPTVKKDSGLAIEFNNQKNFEEAENHQKKVEKKLDVIFL
jgi:hypothetical protein